MGLLSGLKKLAKPFKSLRRTKKLLSGGKKPKPIMSADVQGKPALQQRIAQGMENAPGPMTDASDGSTARFREGMIPGREDIGGIPAPAEFAAGPPSPGYAPGGQRFNLGTGQGGGLRPGFTEEFVGDPNAKDQMQGLPRQIPKPMPKPLMSAMPQDQPQFRRGMGGPLERLRR